MPPRFRAEYFRFNPDTSVPDHIEGEPDKDERNPQKIWLEESERVLAIDIDGWYAASELKEARFRELEETGQQVKGVFIRLPGGAE